MMRAFEPIRKRVPKITQEEAAAPIRRDWVDRIVLRPHRMAYLETNFVQRSQRLKGFEELIDNPAPRGDNSDNGGTLSVL
jgi:hypothetical protein